MHRRTLASVAGLFLLFVAYAGLSLVVLSKSQPSPSLSQAEEGSAVDVADPIEVLSAGQDRQPLPVGITNVHHSSEDLQTAARGTQGQQRSADLGIRR